VGGVRGVTLPGAARSQVKDRRQGNRGRSRERPRSAG
jgi:hypothetical protein